MIVNALRENTKAVRANTAALAKLTTESDKEMSKTERRKTVMEGVPYTEDQLLAFKRQDLVMLAAQLQVRNTSIPQKKLVKAVLKAQETV